MRTLLAILFLLLAAPSDTAAQPPVLTTDVRFQETTRAAIDSLYNRNPEAARELMKPWAESWPDHPIWELWDAMELWWVVLTDIFDHSHDEELIQKMEQADRAAVELLRSDSSHPDGYVIRTVANGYIARQHSNRNRWIQSVRTARNAQLAHEKMGQLLPDLSDNLFAEGLKLYYAAHIPEAYPVVRAVSWLLPDGDKQRGLELLEKTSRDAVFVRPEAIYFMGNILLNYEHDYEEATRHFQHLVERYPDNSYYRRLLVRALFRQNRHVEAHNVIDRSLEYWESHQYDDEEVLREELLYWKGRIEMKTGSYRRARTLLDESFTLGKQLPNTSERSFQALSGYYAGLASEWSGDPGAAGDYYKQVVRLDCEKDVRDQARARLSDLQ